MKLKATVAGLTYTADNLGVIADHYRQLAMRERERSMRVMTIKEARYYEGRAGAFDEVAEFLAAFEEV